MSEVLIEEDFEAIWGNLPKHIRLKNPRLIFSSERDGATMQSLLRHAQAATTKHIGTIIAIRTDSDAVIGAFLDKPLQIDKNYAMGFDMMVFSLHPVEKFYELSGENEWHLFVTNEIIAIGGGGEGPALTIDSELYKWCSL